jgi:hypothetical protein
VAGDGYAGLEARAAAEAAIRADETRRKHTESRVLRAVLRQAEAEPALHPPPGTPPDRHAAAILQKIGQPLGRGGPQTGQAIATLASVFAPVGVTPDDTNAHMIRLITLIEDTRDDIARACEASGDSGSIMLARSVATAMALILPFARRSLNAAQTLMTDPLAVLARWVANPSQIAEAAGRTAWILDGWEPICLLWRAGTTYTARGMALLEMAQRMPVMPREAETWSQSALHPDLFDPACRVTCQNDLWRSGGAAFTLVGRNESIRAMSL